MHYAALGSAIEAWPSLVGARFGSNVETAELLLRAGAEVQIRDDAGCTPMHYAAGQPCTHYLHHKARCKYQVHLHLNVHILLWLVYHFLLCCLQGL